MKKSILLSLAVALAGMGVSAQDNPNRMLVVNSAGTYTSYNLGGVDKVKFATVEGTVACDVKVNKFTNTSINLDATRTEACNSFTIGVFPGIIARSFVGSPEMTQAYMQQANAPRYFEDFIGGELTGIQLEAGTEYAVVTQGYDSYNTPCEARAAYFTTKAADIVGNPEVTATVLGSTKTEISFRFKANADVQSYYYVIFKKGKFEEDYSTFAPMFGFTNPGQMIKMWGSEHPGNSEDEYTYTNLDPNTDYELYIQALDKKGNFAPLVMVEASTEKQGGSGESKIDIKLGDYKLTDWGGEMLPSQFVTYTPNSETWCYRFNVLLAVNYDKDPEGYNTELQQDPEQDIAYWFFYEPLTTDYQIDPDTKYVVIASGKNADGVWGPVNVVKGTTPSQAKAKPAAVSAKSIRTRPMPSAPRQNGQVPAVATMRLTH